MASQAKLNAYPIATRPNLTHLNARELIQEILVGSRRLAPSALSSEWPLTLTSLAHLSEVELAHALGITAGKARRIGAVLELHRRLQSATVPPRPSCQKPEEVAAILHSLPITDVERFYCLALDPHSRLIGSPILMSQGDVDGTDAGPRAFFRGAIRSGAVSAIAVHNHPSGDVTPSAADRAVTQRLTAAGRALDIALVDHVIFATGGTWISLRRSSPELFR